METKGHGPAHPSAGSAGMLRHVPHALSALRVILVLVTYYAAWRQDAPLFAVLVLLAVLTDILDGPLARHLGTASRFGANVDSACDFLFYASLPFWAWLFQPELIATPKVLVPAGTLAILYVGANVLSHRVFGALGVHNRLSRTSGTFGTLATFYTILWGLHWIAYYGLIILLSADVAQRYGALWQEKRRRKEEAARAAATPPAPQGR